MRSSIRYKERRLANTALAAGAAFGCDAFESDSPAGPRRGNRMALVGGVLGILTIAIVYFLLR